MLRIFGSAFCRESVAIAMGEFHLHVRDAGAVVVLAEYWNGKFRDTGEFPQPGKIALL